MTDSTSAKSHSSSQNEQDKIKSINAKLKRENNEYVNNLDKLNIILNNNNIDYSKIINLRNKLENINNKLIETTIDFKYIEDIKNIHYLDWIEQEKNKEIKIEDNKRKGIISI